MPSGRSIILMLSALILIDLLIVDPKVKLVPRLRASQPDDFADKNSKGPILAFASSVHHLFVHSESSSSAKASSR